MNKTELPTELRLRALENGYLNEIPVRELITVARWATEAQALLHSILEGYEHENWSAFNAICRTREIDEDLAVRDALVEISRALLADLPDAPSEDKWRCPSCGYTDSQQLREGVNNHWRKGYVEGIRPRSEDAICYQALIPEREGH